MLNALGKQIVEINKNNGWNTLTPTDWDLVYKIPAILVLIHSEVSEALEAFRHNDRENFTEELADIIIRTLDCAAGLRADIMKAVVDKLEKNKGRGYRHGGKRI